MLKLEDEILEQFEETKEKTDVLQEFFQQQEEA